MFWIFEKYGCKYKYEVVKNKRESVSDSLHKYKSLKINRVVSVDDIERVVGGSFIWS